MTGQRPSTLADKINKLFATVRDEQGREYSPEYVAGWLRDTEGPSISVSYLYLLRRGERDNPTKTHIEAIARFFQIPAAYFFDEEYGGRIAEQLELLAAMRDHEVRDIALRSASLHGDARRSVAEILRSMAPWASRSASSSQDAGTASGRPKDEPPHEGPAGAADDREPRGAVGPSTADPSGGDEHQA